MKPNDKELFRKLPDADMLGILLYLEARGEPVEGQIAVGCVVRNRVKVKQGNSYFTIITAKNQFSCFNSNDPGYDRGMSMVKELAEGKMPEDLRGLLGQCRWIAYGIVNGALLDNTKKANHYFNPKIYSPEWAGKMIITAKIGNHVFLKG